MRMRSRSNRATLAVAALAALTPTSTFPTGAISPATSHEVPALAHVVSVLAGRTTTVNCWSNADWNRMIAAQVKSGYLRLANAAAFTNIGLHQVQVSPYVCETLAKVLAHRPAGELDTALAVEVLAHESRHAAGISNEARAECGGMQRTPRAAELLGIPAARAQRLMHVFRGTVYPSDAPEYKSATCRAGLPGLLVPNEFGPAAAVALLRAHTQPVGAALGWRSLPAPPGPLSPCSPVGTRERELARVESMFGHGRDTVNVSATVLRTAADFREAVAGTRRSFTCIAAMERRELKRAHPNATFVTKPLPARPHVLGYRTITQASVTDLFIVTDPRTRMFAALSFLSRNGPPPAAAESRAVQTIEHGS